MRFETSPIILMSGRNASLRFRKSSCSASDVVFIVNEHCRRPTTTYLNYLRQWGHAFVAVRYLLCLLVSVQNRLCRFSLKKSFLAVYCWFFITSQFQVICTGTDFSSCIREINKLISMCCVCISLLWTIVSLLAFLFSSCTSSFVTAIVVVVFCTNK